MERFGYCYRCQGTGAVIDWEFGERQECGKCDGTGESGDARDYMEAQAKPDHDREHNEIYKGDRE